MRAKCCATATSHFYDCAGRVHTHEQLPANGREPNYRNEASSQAGWPMPLMAPFSIPCSGAQRLAQFESIMVVVQAETRYSHHTVDSGNRVYQIVELSGAADF